MPSAAAVVRGLQLKVSELEAESRLRIGTGYIPAAAIGQRAVLSKNISVVNLEAVNSKTGALTIDGALTVTTAGSIGSGQSAYNTGTGFWLEYNAGTPRFSIGNPAGDALTWDGSVLTVTGRLNFGTNDYLDNDVLHFQSNTTETTSIQFEASGAYPFDALLTSKHSSTDSLLRLYSYKESNSANRSGLLITQTTAAPETYIASIFASNDSGIGASVSVSYQSAASNVALTASDTVKVTGFLKLTSTISQIVSGSLDLQPSNTGTTLVRVSAETGTADDLDTVDIGNAEDGSLFIFKAYPGHTITVRHNTGGGIIRLAGGTNFVMDTEQDSMMFLYNSSTGHLEELSRANVPAA